MKTRKQPRCNPDIAVLAATNAHLGNIAFRTGTKLHWDGAKLQFKDNPKANALLRPSYRDPWKLPQV